MDKVRAALGARIKRDHGDKLDALCPAHDDQHASLVVSRGEKCVVFYCHKGCPQESIVAELEKLGVRASELFYDHAENRGRQKEAEYPYVDLNGEELYSKIRYTGKYFSWRGPNGEPGLSNVGRRIPYRLPDLTGQAEIFIVEGEKDADNLHKALGVPATTSGGANSWTVEHSNVIKSLGVQRAVILPDNDEAGLRYADDVAAKCAATGVAVRVVRLPGLDVEALSAKWRAVQAE